MASKGNIALLALVVLLAVACIGLLIAYIQAINVSTNLLKHDL
jgi:hypothetical protein